MAALQLLSRLQNTFYEFICAQSKVTHPVPVRGVLLPYGVLRCHSHQPLGADLICSRMNASLKLRFLAWEEICLRQCYRQIRQYTGKNHASIGPVE